MGEVVGTMRRQRSDLRSVAKLRWFDSVLLNHTKLPTAAPTTTTPIAKGNKLGAGSLRGAGA